MQIVICHPQTSGSASLVTQGVSAEHKVRGWRKNCRAKLSHEKLLTYHGVRLLLLETAHALGSTTGCWRGGETKECILQPLFNLSIPVP